MPVETASSLALEAFFDEGDSRFLAEVLRSTHARALGALAPRWYKDRRPQMRRLLLEYIDDGCERPNHQPLIKRLFKAAEAAKDDEALAHFLVAFDRLPRRKLEQRTHWDWRTQQSETTERLVRDPKIPWGHAPTANMAPVDGRAPEPPVISVRDPYSGRLNKKKLVHLETFTFRTRRYLARRVWRYFRILGKTSPDKYRDAMVIALQLYRDEQLGEATQLLDAWGLVHALYHHSPVLEQDKAGWTVAAGESLANLKPAPIYPEVWKQNHEPLFDLLVRARARTVLLFALAMLRAHHGPALERVELGTLRRILLSPHEEVQVFAAELLRKARGVELLPVAEWLKLLSSANAIVLPILCELFERSVHPDRVSADACVQLAKAAAAPVARLGFTWLKQRPVNTEADVARVLELADAQADVVRGEAIDWVIATISSLPEVRPIHARDLADAKYLDVREKAVAWIFRDPRLKDELMLWAALCETPYDDVRAALVRHLESVRGSGAIGTVLDAASLRHVWASVLLAVDRGSRAKVQAARQVAERVAANPGEADGLLPLLGISLRSLRVPERRSALAALGRAAYFALDLRASISRHLPSLILFSDKLSVPALPPPSHRAKTAGESKGAIS